MVKLIFLTQSCHDLSIIAEFQIFISLDSLQSAELENPATNEHL